MTPEWLEPRPDIDELARLIPPVEDRVLLELANSIEVVGDLVRHRDSFFGRLWSDVSGKSRRRRELLDTQLARGHERLTHWVTDLAEGQRVTNVGLQRAVLALQGTMATVHALGERVDRHDERLAGLSEIVSELAKAVELRFADLEQRVATLELKDLARDRLDNCVSAWRHGDTYAGLPWPFDVVLLVREVYATEVGVHETRTGDDVLRRRMVDEIVRGSQGERSPFSMAKRLERSAAEVDAVGLAMIAELLDAGLDSRAALRDRPHTAALRATAELASLGIPRSGEHALALARRHAGALDETSDVVSFARAIVTETADGVVEVLRHHSPDGGAVPPEPLASGTRDERSSRPVPSAKGVAPPRPRRGGSARLGLVLPGGGALGAYQLGAVRCMADAGLQPCALAGSSIGALNAAVLGANDGLAAGLAALEAIWKSLPRAIPRNPVVAAMREAPRAAPEPLARLLNQAVLDPDVVLELVTASVEIEQLRNGSPVWITAFPGTPGGLPLDWFAAKALRMKPEYFLLQDHLDDAHALVAASAALPLALPGRRAAGRFFRDGGLGDNVPVSSIAGECDVLIVIHLRSGTPWSQVHEEIDTPIVEVRPRGDPGTKPGYVRSLLDFSPRRIAALREQGYADAARCFERVATLLGVQAARRRAEAGMIDAVSRL